MAFWCSRFTQSKLRQLAHHCKNIPYASSSSLLNPTVSKPCVSDNPLISLPGFGSKVRFFAAPVQANANAKKAEQGTNGPRLNENIKADVVRLVVGEEHFVISKSEALKRARNLELDLVEVNNIDVVYTPWSNLKNTASMDVDQVCFYSSKNVRTVRVEKRINEIVNRLNRTKVDRKPDLKG